MHDSLVITGCKTTYENTPTTDHKLSNTEKRILKVQIDQCS